MELQSTNDFIMQYAQSNLDTAICLIPPSPIKIISQELTLQYEREKLGFEWRTQNRVLPENLLGDLEFLIKEYSKRDIPDGENSSASSSNSSPEKSFDTKG